MSDRAPGPSTRLPTAVEEIGGAFCGRLLLPSDTGYETARRVHNGMVDRRPAVVAQCRGAADVADALALARSVGLDVAVKGGGHNVGGRATIDDGVMIDLSPMRSVHVDPARGVAHVDGGALWRDVNRETQLHGLATTGGAVGTTGVAGLTLGGGVGWLMAKHGLALDNLEAVDLVLADGTPVHASADEHDDLFWALRGGGGNFGVVHRFTFRLHEVGPEVYGGLVAWPFAAARDVLRFFRDLGDQVGDDVMLFAALMTDPASGSRLVGIAAGHFGRRQEAEAAFRPIKELGDPVMDVLGPIPYVALNSMLDASFPVGARNYWKSHFLAELSDDAIDAIVEGFASCPMPMGQVMLEHFHGAATRVPVSETAFALRQPGYNLALLGEWLDAADDDRSIGWIRQAYGAVQPFCSPRRYMNYFDADDGGLEAVYGPNLPRLREVKRRYDPDNVFRRNVNIPPA